jgi:hypothetical protein
MARQTTTRNANKSIVIKMRKAHRILIIAMFSILFLSMLAAMIYVVTLTMFEIETILLLLTIPAFLFLPLPLYYATWQITFDAHGIQKRLWGIHSKKYVWAQVKEVRSAWLISERSNGISIIFKDNKTIRFRMDCDNAKQAKQLILSHCSINEQSRPYI